MNYRVELSPRARLEIRTAVRWWADNHSNEQAERWSVAAMQAVRSLSWRAARCPVAPEDGIVPFPIYQHTFGLGRRPSHRVIFTITPSNEVSVLTIRHLARDALRPEDLK